ncbi:MAG: sugar transferase [Candidatus Eremiobacteraeota bacterium]|nr:sugar transferase [Candidatus Eremiobacteraeota bacterium]
MGLIDLTSEPVARAAARPPLVALEPRVSTARTDVWKRAIDVVLGTFFLIISVPIVIVASVAIVLVSHGAPIFVQQRVGKNGKPFKMFKLRTMVDGAHLLHDELRHLSEVDGPVLKIRKDPRLHPLGAFLRKTSIDELPNFLNVLFGDMSLVGPRPPLPCEVVHYSEYACRRLSVKPGITGLWQISGRSNVSFDEWMRLDNLYIDTMTPVGDLGIILRTIPAVIRGVGAH